MMLPVAMWGILWIMLAYIFQESWLSFKKSLNRALSLTMNMFTSLVSFLRHKWNSRYPALHWL